MFDDAIIAAGSMIGASAFFKQKMDEACVVAGDAVKVIDLAKRLGVALGLISGLI
ncbi:hypothetical protein N9060_01410 [Arenicella sp.]|nr:hypothetical protein [Arenicella sp.]